jgi:hypothetical protein
MSEQLKSRLLSLVWRTLAMCGVVILTAIAQNIGQFELPDWVVVIVGLVCGELTKYLNNSFQLGARLKALNK